VDNKKNRIVLLGKKPGVAGRPANPTPAKDVKEASEEWIPTHHKKSAKGGVTSGEDTDTGYTSTGTKATKRKVSSRK